MAEKPDPLSSTKFRQIIGLLFGVFLVALAGFVAATSDASNRVGSIVVAVVIGGLGLDLVINTVRRKPSLLGRIGPVP